MDAPLVALTADRPVRQIDVALKAAGKVSMIRLDDPAAIQAILALLARFGSSEDAQRVEGTAPAMNE